MRHDTLPEVAAAAAEPELHELLTVDDFAGLLRVSKSWCTNTRAHVRLRPPIVCPIFGSESTSVSKRRQCGPFSRARRTRAEPAQSYNGAGAKPRRANARKGHSHGST
jgi:hypothetical protein